MCGRAGIAPPIEHQAAVTSVAVTPDRTAIITGSRYGGARIWDAATHAKVAEFKAHDRFVTAIALVPPKTDHVSLPDPATAQPGFGISCRSGKH